MIMVARVLMALFLASTPAWAGELVALPSSRVVEVARAAVDAKLAGMTPSAVVAVVGHPDDLRVQGGKLALKARITSGAWPRPRVAVPVDVSVDGHVVNTTVVWFSLSVPTSGPGYATSYPAGTDARELSTLPVDYDAAAMPGVVASLPTGDEPMRLRRAVHAGDPLRGGDFERWPDVARGEHVQVTIQSGHLRLSAQAVAIGNGSRGEKVSVMVQGADAAVQAEVTGKGEVQVAL